MAAGQLNDSCAPPLEMCAPDAAAGLGCARPGPSTSPFDFAQDRLGTNGGGVSRRTVLGAALGFPLIAQQEAPPPGFTRSPSPANAGADWESALAAYRSAEAGVRAEERVTAGATAEEEAAREEVYGERLDAMYDSLRRLLRVAAPDVAALAVKIELMIQHEVATLTGGEACLAAIRGDARRLAG